MPVDEQERPRTPELVLMSSSKDVMPADLLVLPRLSMAAGTEELQRIAKLLGLEDADDAARMPLLLSLRCGSRPWQERLNEAYLQHAIATSMNPYE